MSTSSVLLEPADLVDTESTLQPSVDVPVSPSVTCPDSGEGSELPGSHRPERVVVEADEIVFKAGEATLTLSCRNGGTLEICAPRIQIRGDEVLSEATQTNSVVGHHVVTEAELAADVLGKLIRIDGQCVKINC